MINKNLLNAVVIDWQVIWIRLNEFIYQLKYKTMRPILYLVAIILIIGWLVGAFFYTVGGIIHILLVLAVISIVVGLVQRA
jgi:hypothetical protein